MVYLSRCKFKQAREIQWKYLIKWRGLRAILAVAGEDMNGGSRKDEVQ